MNDTQPAPKIVVTAAGDVYEDDEASAEEDAFRDAAHMLHEQAHGTDVAWRFCRQEPCRNLPTGETSGPASLTLGLF